MKYYSGTKLNYRSYAALGIVALFGVVTVSCNSGGGGGDDGGGTQTSTLNYYLDMPRAGTPSLSVQMAGLNTTFNNLSARGTLIQAVAPATENAVTLSSSTTPVVSLATGTLFGDLPVMVTQTFSWTGSNHPTAGEFTVTLGANGSVRSTVLPGGAGVRVALYDINNVQLATEDYSWANFEVLWEDDNASTYKRVASFVYGARSFLYDQVDTALEAMYMIEDNRAALQAAGSDQPLVANCSTNPPPGIGQNTVTMTWTDVDGSGTINHNPAGGLDTIHFTFNGCWVDDPADDIDAVLNGMLRFNYYEPHLQWGVAYIEFVVTETDMNGPIQGSGMTINGGFAFLAAGM